MSLHHLLFGPLISGKGGKNSLSRRLEISDFDYPFEVWYGRTVLFQTGFTFLYNGFAALLTRMRKWGSRFHCVYCLRRSPTKSCIALCLYCWRRMGSTFVEDKHSGRWKRTSSCINLSHFLNSVGNPGLFKRAIYPSKYSSFSTEFFTRVTGIQIRPEYNNYNSNWPVFKKCLVIVAFFWLLFVIDDVFSYVVAHLGLSSSVSSNLNKKASCLKTRIQYISRSHITAASFSNRNCIP